MGETEHEQPEETPFEAPEPHEPEQDEEEEAAEHETAAEGGPSEADEQPEPEALSERDLDKMREKMDKEATRHRNRISEILGEQAQWLVPCELCLPEMPGFHWPVEDQKAYSPLHARLLDVLRAPDEPDYRTAPHARTCEVCDGYGNVLSGSRMPNNRLVVCPACGGTGYNATGSGVANGSAVEQPAAVLAAVGADAGPASDTDPWGSPRLMPDGQPNPNYGRMIQFKDPNLP